MRLIRKSLAMFLFILVGMMFVFTTIASADQNGDYSWTDTITMDEEHWYYFPGIEPEGEPIEIELTWDDPEDNVNIRLYESDGIMTIIYHEAAYDNENSKEIHWGIYDVSETTTWVLKVVGDPSGSEMTYTLTSNNHRIYDHFVEGTYTQGGDDQTGFACCATAIIGVGVAFMGIFVVFVKKRN